jgi:hypothetical protein
MMLMAISASVIQVLGLIPPYFELAKRHGRVVGINFWFLIIDYAGAFFSLMAVVAQEWFDALGSSLYIACMVLETGIFLSQAVWLWRVRGVRREAKRAGVGYDEFVKAHPDKAGVPGSRGDKGVVDVEAGVGGVMEEKEGDLESRRTTFETTRSGDSVVREPPAAVVQS